MSFNNLKPINSQKKMNFSIYSRPNSFRTGKNPLDMEKSKTTMTY